MFQSLSLTFLISYHHHALCQRHHDDVDGDGNCGNGRDDDDGDGDGGNGNDDGDVDDGEDL